MYSILAWGHNLPHHHGKGVGPWIPKQLLTYKLHLRCRPLSFSTGSEFFASVNAAIRHLVVCNCVRKGTIDSLPGSLNTSRVSSP